MRTSPLLPHSPLVWYSMSGRGGLFTFLHFLLMIPVVALLWATPAQAASASCSLPYGGLIHANTVFPIARAAAYLAALDVAATSLQQHKAARLGARDPLVRQALTAAVHRPAIKTSPDNASRPPQGMLRVDVRLDTPARTVDSRMRQSLGQGDMLDMRITLLAHMRKAADEGSTLALQAAQILSQYGEKAQQSVDERLYVLGKKLEAFWLLDEALTYLQGIWQTPRQVLRLLQEATELEPDSEQAWALLGEVQLQLDQPLKALESLHQALRLQPDQARALYARGLAHLRLQQPALAEADCSAALRLRPNNAAWLRARGAARMVLEDFGPMCEDFERACALGDCDGLIAARKRELCLPHKAKQGGQDAGKQP